LRLGGYDGKTSFFHSSLRKSCQFCLGWASGSATALAGNVDLHTPDPDARRALAGVADAAGALPAFKHAIIVLAYRA